MEVPSILLNRLLSETAKKGASSLHLTVGSLPVWRLAGEMVTMDKESIITADLLMKIIGSFLTVDETNLLAAEKEIVLLKTFGSDFRFRVNVYYQKKMLSVSFCYVPQTFRKLSDYKLPKILMDSLSKASGLLVITGPKTSGKTSLTASLVEEINAKQAERIITIEKPIEYAFVSKKSIVEQRQVGVDAKNFHDALVYCLEEEAEVVVVGEMKSEFDSAIPTILELAAGNSLVILEINAPNSIRALERLLSAASQKISAEAARYSLADELIGVIAMNLLPHRGGGQVAAIEVMLVNSAVKALIREGKIYQLDSVIQTSRKEGMVSLEKAIEELVDEGEVRQEDV